ncbi:hypothetical protein K437DRAFT_223350 [Tilletiaria anomala UBC 951]|uniref:UspA domain-containing protein n=1 Tax=Tilletiaria anomala (strain ATCC 24038 / CBS 436.72 / UBC 951) TaxID=1037660 RepID=A0A066W372_TILAU|nr:uncharacterized protein K437DRAFT_223350 [Tilletiaria anomala UBC 951]KDN46993.1 hypothetical protein K437DRAFT_223350 [Tilletiaria anomala UBC 951]
MASASASGSGSGSRTGTGGGAGLSANLGPIVASRVPPKGWERKVGFDTMPDAMETESQSFSFTLQARSKGYVRTKNTRTFMCAVDNNTYSERALEWLMESLVEDGDEVVALRVLEGEADTIDQDEAREDANELMAQVVDLNEEILGRRISIVIEFIAGRPTSTIMRLIHMYRPDSLTIGTRGKSANALQKMLSGGSLSIGHVSRDLLSRSPVPVVVVRPEAKVQKHLKKRLNDPARRGYHDLIKGSGFDLQALPMSVSKSKRESLHLHHHGSSRRSVNTSSSTFGSSAEKSKGRHHRKTTSSSSLSNVAGTAKGITGDVGLSSARSSIDADHLSSQFAKPDASTSDAINADASANAGGSADALAPVPSRSSQHSSDSHWLRVDEEGNCYTSDGSAGTSAAGKEVETALRVAGAGTRARAGDSAGVH